MCSFLEHFNKLSSWNHKTGSAKDKCDSFKKVLKQLMDISNSSMDISAPPIITEYVDIQENNRKCNNGYRYLIREIIVKFEDEQGCNDNEKISECTPLCGNYSISIIDIISEYHHHRRFWTVTPENHHDIDIDKESSLSYHFSVANNNDDDDDDDDGDYPINAITNTSSTTTITSRNHAQII